MGINGMSFGTKYCVCRKKAVPLHRFLKEASIEPMFHVNPVSDHYGVNTGAIPGHYLPNPSSVEH